MPFPNPRLAFAAVIVACAAAAGRGAALPTAVDDPVSGIAFVLLPAGRFTMGSPPDERGRNADETPHAVTIAQPFYLARTETTQQQWHDVMGTSPAAFASCGAQCPVENVSFADVQRFLDRLNAKRREADRPVTGKYRLPTEAEWEYACRAGTSAPFSTGETLRPAQANFNGRFPYGSDAPGEFRGRPVPVGSFAPNPWGLADMHGNVWEWTADWYGPYSREAVDPDGRPSGGKRVIRGGSWYFDANSARCALRYTHAPADKGFSLGFRAAADALRPRAPERPLR